MITIEFAHNLASYNIVSSSSNHILPALFPLSLFQRKNGTRKLSPTAISTKNKYLVTNYDFKLCSADQPDLYPNCDAQVWLRSCEKEVIEPINGTVKGDIPKWLNGCLLRNGPGSLKIGRVICNHLFDSYAMIHK